MHLKSDDVASFMYSAWEARLSKLTPAKSLSDEIPIDEQGTVAGNTIWSLWSVVQVLEPIDEWRHRGRETIGLAEHVRGQGLSMNKTPWSGNYRSLEDNNPNPITHLLKSKLWPLSTEVDAFGGTF